MANTKRSALAPGFTVDLTALHEQRPDVASNAQALLEATSTKPQASSIEPQAPSDSSNKQQASSPKQQASSAKPQAASDSILDPS